jgi:hypothetical protein
MSYHKVIATELVKEWSVKELDAYLTQLKARHAEEGEWIRTVQEIRRKLVKKKTTPENGPRDGR